MPRRYRRRRRRPKARKRVDKVQNRRIARLENAIEKKFIQESPYTQLLSGNTESGAGGPNTLQIYRALPRIDSGGALTDEIQLANPLVGNTINLRHVHCSMTLTPNYVPTTGALSPSSVRVIVFWYKQPITWNQGAPTDAETPVGGTLTRPSWDQLLFAFNGNIGTGVDKGQQNMSAQLNKHTTSANKTPISILSDKVFQFGTTSGPKKWSFSKSYKAMKLAYNSYETAAGALYAKEPVNRQLYVAVVPSVPPSTDPSSGHYFTLSRTMHYTDC